MEKVTGTPLAWFLIGMQGCRLEWHLICWAHSLTSVRGPLSIELSQPVFIPTVPCGPGLPRDLCTYDDQETEGSLAE